MRITQENYKIVPEKEHNILKSILDDLDFINKSKVYSKDLYIEWQDYHNEWSPERVDPCPDYYGYYSLYFEDSDFLVGVEMSLDELDSALCLLYNIVEHERKSEDTDNVTYKMYELL